MSTPRKGRKRPFADRVHTFIGDFPDLCYDGSQIWCDVCNIPLMCWDIYDCKRHVNSVAHLQKSGVSPRTRSIYTVETLTGIYSLAIYIIALAIMIFQKSPETRQLLNLKSPPCILENKSFKEFWNKYSEVKLPSRTALWLCVDETTDRKKHYIVNVLVYVMDTTKPTSPLLLASKRLQKCTAEAITHMILETLENFQLLTSQVLLFVTDGAATMLSVDRSLKEHGCSFLHVTYKVHALHLVIITRWGT
ncbi:hypothetical protein NQ318_002870 [Aromia moschata]|uniref:DUF659 domain-containing protein n=1 Tax=Aromia moschata TaxID=1265417 RepID=A0AAV8Y781_9CUCU|nr:hypothetical protein NQ318_002870 [Aromia moschata]